jgi:hypothetical protein
VIHHAAQQIVECGGWDYEPPRFLVHDRDNCYGTSFDRRLRRLGIAQARTPFRSPRANAIAERWVRSVRTECLDHVFIQSVASAEGLGRVCRLFQQVAPASFDWTKCALRAEDTCVASKRPSWKDHRNTDGGALLRNLTSGKISRLDFPFPIEHAEFSPDGSRVLTRSQNRSVPAVCNLQLWNSDTGSKVAEICLMGERLPDARFGSDGAWIETHTASGAQIWDGHDGRHKAEFPDQT